MNDYSFEFKARFRNDYTFITNKDNSFNNSVSCIICISRFTLAKMNCSHEIEHLNLNDIECFLALISERMLISNESLSTIQRAVLRIRAS